MVFFYFPHNPDVGKKKDFLWVAAITLIFYADNIFPSLKKKSYGKIIPLQLGSYSYSNFRVKKRKKEKKKKHERFASLSPFSS